MRFPLKLISFVLVLVLIGFLTPVDARPNVHYSGLLHTPHFSPNGRHTAVIVEDRYPGGSEFSLMLWTHEEDGDGLMSAYCLTPRYEEFIKTPDGKIAFIDFDTTYHFGVHLYNPDTLEMERGLTYSTDRITQLQFSKDARSLCYFLDLAAHPYASLKEKIAGTLSQKGWIVEKNRKTTFTQSGRLIFSKDEKEALLEWAPIVRPEEIPLFFRQPLPKITLETQIHWSPDSKYLYVLEETGIWRLELGSLFFPQWTKIVQTSAITRFHLSPTGRHLLYEVVPDKEKGDFLIKAGKYDLPDPYEMMRDIGLVDIAVINVDKKPPTDLELAAARGPIWLLDATPLITPRKITRGWGATFNPIGKTFTYHSFTGGMIFTLEKREAREVQPTGYIY